MNNSKIKWNGLVILIFLFFCVANAREWTYKDFCNEFSMTQQVVGELWRNTSANHWPKSFRNLLDDVIQHYRIFESGENLSGEEMSVFRILTPKLNDIPNPLFTYILWELAESERYKKIPLPEKQKICTRLLHMLENENYKKQWKDIVDALLQHFPKAELYSKESLQLIEKKCSSELVNVQKSFPLLPLMLEEESSNDIFGESFYRIARKQADSCDTMDKSKIGQFILLVMVAGTKYDNGFYSVKLKNIVLNEIEEGRRRSDEVTNPWWDIRRACSIFALTRKQVVFDILKECLKEKSYFDRGIDVFPHYWGPAYFAACAMHSQVKSFPSFSNTDFYKHKGRERCLKWLQENTPKNFHAIKVYDEPEDDDDNMHWDIRLRYTF